MTSWDPSQRRSSCLVNLHPHPNTLTKAILDLVEASNWEGFTVLYDDYLALVKIQGLVKLAGDKGYLVAVRQLEYHGEDYGYRSVLHNIKFSNERNIVIECSVDILYQVLIEAQQVGLMGKEYSYIIHNLDFQTIDYTPFKWGGTNITMMRLVNPEAEYVREITSTWELADEEGNRQVRQVDYEENGDYDIGTSTELVPTSSELPPTSTPDISVIPDVGSSLVHDAVVLFAKSLNNFGPISMEPLSCLEPTNSFKYGYSLVNYMHLSDLEGMTGRVQFDHEGYRSEVELAVEQLTHKGPKLKGTWNGTLSLLDQEPPGVYPDDGEDLRNVSFVVLIALTHPYIMLKENTKPLTGNDRYEGFGVDLINELSKMTGFNYTFKEHTSKSSGNPVGIHPNGTRIWDGLIGEVLAWRADLAIADITITQDRLKDADFTDPFMNLGVSILYRKPTKAPPKLLTFMDPFSSEVWLYVMAVYVGVSLLFFAMARLSPYEWTNPYPCIQDPEFLENQFSLMNSFWFTVGSLMQQGSDIAPLSGSTRLVAAIWWFFTLIMVSQYTAQLASFLTVENPVQPFKDVKGLANQNKINYGAKTGGTTETFFKESSDPTYQKIYSFMKSHPHFMKGNEEGVEMVINNDDYAFFMESVSIEYEVSRKCKLAMIGDLLDNKGYGIVMRQNSTYRKVLSKNIVHLQEKGKLAVMKAKWWTEKRGGGACSGEGDKAGAEKLTLANTGGVFFVLVCGCLFGVFIALCEVIWDIYKRENKTSFKEEVKDELRFILLGQSKVKPVKNASLFGSNDGLRKQSLSKQSTVSQRL